MIRLVKENDLDKILEIEMESFSSPWLRKDFLYELNENPYASLYLLEKDDEIVAYADLWIVFERSELSNIAVKSNFRHQGYASELMEFVIKESEKKSCEYMFLDVRVSNTPAINLYRKYNFQDLRIKKGYYNDNYEDALEMVCVLNGEEYA